MMQNRSTDSMTPAARAAQKLGVPFALITAAATSVATQMELAQDIGWEPRLAWLLPAAVVTWEAVSTIRWAGIPSTDRWAKAKKHARNNALFAVGVSLLLNSISHMLHPGQVHMVVTLLVSAVPNFVVACLLHGAMSGPAEGPESSTGARGASDLPPAEVPAWGRAEPQETILPEGPSPALRPDLPEGSPSSTARLPKNTAPVPAEANESTVELPEGERKATEGSGTEIPPRRQRKTQEDVDRAVAYLRQLAEAGGDPFSDPVAPALVRLYGGKTERAWRSTVAQAREVLRGQWPHPAVV